MTAFLIILPMILIYVVFAIWAERKVSAFIQDRYGPMEVGFYGLAQTIADLLKLLQKEDIVPAAADKKIFQAAPPFIFVAIFAGYSVLPLSPDIIGSRVKTGVFFLLTIISLDVMGLMLAGWGSNNKYGVFGALRAISQIISYEIPLTLSVLAVVIISQSLDLQEISYQQGVWINHFPGNETAVNYFLGIKALGLNVTQYGGVFTWNIFRAPVLFIAFIVFFITSLAECNRAPFDVPEAESELVAGFHTEYSGFRWGLLFLAEYAMMMLVSFLGAILFLGSWNTPFVNIGAIRLAEWTSGTPGTVWGNVIGSFWLLSKVLFLIFMQMMVRWTYPRLRVDQLMYLCWKVLTPIAMVTLLVAGIWRLLMVSCG
jgi:NADH-quinone oxidoreductase subunit H